MASSGLPHSDPSDFSTATQGGTSDDPETFAKQILDSGEIKRERVLELVRKLPGLALEGRVTIQLHSLL